MINYIRVTKIHTQRRYRNYITLSYDTVLDCAKGIRIPRAVYDLMIEKNVTCRMVIICEAVDVRIIITGSNTRAPDESKSHVTTRIITLFINFYVFC